MPCHTITESAKLANVSRRTIQRYVKTGKLSARKDNNGNPQIDTSELLRVFPDLSHPKEETLSQAVAQNVTPSNIEQLLVDMMQEIKALRTEIKELKEVQRIEYKPDQTQAEEYPVLAKNKHSELDYIPSLADFVDQ